MPASKHPITSNGNTADPYRLILENVRDFAIFSVDLRGRVEKWNPGAARFFGYEESEILGQPMEVLYVPEDRAAGRAELEKAQAALTGSSEDERWHLKKDGSRFFVSGFVNAMYDDDHHLCGFIKVARDVTARKLLQEQLSASEAKHRLILETIKDFALITLDLNGVIQSWNAGAEVTFGYTEREMLGQNHAVLYSKSAQAKREAETQLAEAVRTGVSQREHWLSRKDGKEVYVIDVLRPMTNACGQAHAVLKVSRDVTQRQVTRMQLEAAQRELQQIREDLEQQVARRTGALEQTIQSLELVLYHVAHDLRAPLRAMEGFSSILVNRYRQSADSETVRLTDMISEAARRMDHLIQDLLTYGRLCHEPVRREKVGLSTALETALLELREDVQQSGAQVDIKGALPKIWGDPLVLSQVLAQLLSNAMRFAVVGRPPHIVLWAEPRESNLRLWIEDNGIGIEPEYLDRIFWLFERLSQENSASTGMGLPIARKGMDRMEGSIGVQSTPGVGSRFWIELPAVLEDKV